MWCRAWLYDSFCMNMDSQDYDLILAVAGKIVLMILNSSFQRNSIYQNDVVAVEIPENMSKCSRKYSNKVKLLQICLLQLLWVCNGCEWTCVCVWVCVCMYVCVCVCVCVCLVCICVLCIFVCVSMFECVCLCVYGDCLYVHCMYVCVFL